MPPRQEVDSLRIEEGNRIQFEVMRQETLLAVLRQVKVHIYSDTWEAVLD